MPALADASGFRTRWFDGYVQTYLERDLRDLSATGSRTIWKELKGLNAFLDPYEEAPFGVMACLCDQPTVLSSRILALPIAQMLLT